LTNFDIEILFSYYGAGAKPQAAIVGARYSYIAGDFAWTCVSVDDCVDPAVYTGLAGSSTFTGTKVRPFKLRSSVTFVKVSNTGTKLFVPPAPQLINPIPNDVWYPFNIPT
jgi:tectonic-1/3